MDPRRFAALERRRRHSSPPKWDSSTVRSPSLPLANLSQRPDCLQGACTRSGRSSSRWQARAGSCWEISATCESAPARLPLRPDCTSGHLFVLADSARSSRRWRRSGEIPDRLLTTGSEPHAASKHRQSPDDRFRPIPSAAVAAEEQVAPGLPAVRRCLCNERFCAPFREPCSRRPARSPAIAPKPSRARGRRGPSSLRPVRRRSSSCGCCCPTPVAVGRAQHVMIVTPSSLVVDDSVVTGPARPLRC